jgi:hypothetical protein
VTFGLGVAPEVALPDRPDILNVAPLPHDPEFLVRAALERDLSRVTRLRFDPINTCNAACRFCPIDQTGKTSQISPQALDELLRRIAPTCRRITLGCSHEPTMARNFAEYGTVIGAP